MSNDAGKTIKTLVAVKADYKLRRGKRCVKFDIYLELADGVGAGDIHRTMEAVFAVKNRCIEAIGNEFLP